MQMKYLTTSYKSGVAHETLETVTIDHPDALEQSNEIVMDSKECQMVIQNLYEKSSILLRHCQLQFVSVEVVFVQCV